MTADLHWPIGRSGDRVLVVLGADADLLAPLLDGEDEPEDYGSGRWTLLGIPDLEVSPERLADELRSGPEDIWLVLPRSDDASEFYDALAGAMVASGRTPPAAAFLPEPLTLKDVVDQLPSGRDAAEPGQPSRHRLLLDRSYPPAPSRIRLEH